MYEPVPAWRLWLVPPEWFRTMLAFGPVESVRIWRNPDHPFWSRRRMNDCPEARATYRRWWVSLKQSQRSRFYFGLPVLKPRPTARIIRPPQFHSEIARAKREQEAMREWARLHPDRDPIECPLYQERVGSCGRASPDLRLRKRPNDQVGPRDTRRARAAEAALRRR